MAADPILIQSDILSRVATVAQKRYIKNKLPKVDRKYRPLQDVLDQIDEPVAVSGEDGAISDAFKTTPALGGQFWNGLDSFSNPVDVNDLTRFETTYHRFVTPVRMGHDEWLRRGYKIEPHSSMPIETRIKQMGEESLQKLTGQVENFLETVNESHEVSLDLAYHKQGASVKEPLGLNGQLPISTSGSWLGLSRDADINLRHYIGTGTTGTSGTFIDSLAVLLREMKMRVALSGLSGEWLLLAGSTWIDTYRQECVRLGITRNSEASGSKKIDFVITDDALMVAGLKPIWDPTLDNMDVVASSEQGRGISTTNLVSFSGGSPTTAATADAVVDATGKLTNILLKNRGAGYGATAPTVSVSGITMGTLTLTVKVFSGTLSDSTHTLVATDDARIGQVDTITFGGTNNSSGGTAPAAVPFAKRAYFIFKPNLKYRTIKGINRTISIPADPARQRLTELQLETGGYFYLRAPRLNALHYAP